MQRSRSLMKIAEFADELGVTVACIRRWILEGRITIVKLGRLVRIPEAETLRIINAGLRPARAVKVRGEETR
jgi:excisionase family DNA binding protein